jgi:uncharacterized membrane protein YcaP (DUF421 family)
MAMQLLLNIAEAFNTNELLFGEEDQSFLPSVLLRATVMFVVVLVSLRILGKRGVKQLSIFELVIILTLGSAAGDPMFYRDVGLLPAILVFVTVVALYRLVIYLADKSNRFNKLIEGKPVCLINDGIFCYKNFLKEPIALDEFFAELRLQHVSHLGQIRKAYLETSGEVSIFFYPNDRVKYGLPIMPEGFDNCLKKLNGSGYYSCVHCGHTLTPDDEPVETCPTCCKTGWIEACKDPRVS